MKNRKNAPHRSTPQRELQRRRDRHLAIGLALLFPVCLVFAFALDQPILAFAAFIFLIAAVLVEGNS